MFPNITKIEYVVRHRKMYPALRPILQLLADWQWRLFRIAPPPLSVKAKLIASLAAKHQLKNFVETGTFFGDMIAAQVPRFDRLTTIELDPNLYEKACQRFCDCKKVQVLRGNSRNVLPHVLESLTEPTLFWLDGHYSGGITAREESDTPIVEELTAIFSGYPHPHVILIDDARLFRKGSDYPSLEFVSHMLQQYRAGWKLSVADDVICLEPSIAICNDTRSASRGTAMMAADA